MSKYLIPVLEKDDLYISSTSARSMEEAETRFMNKFTREWDLDVPADWDDFCEIAAKSDYYVGMISSIEEFE